MLAEVILIALMAFFKAVADTLSHHYDTSVFRKMDRRWWEPVESSSNVGFLPLTKYRPDAWHLCNSLQLCCIFLAIAIHRPLYNVFIEFFAGGMLFILIFNLFYNKVLRKY